MSKLNAMNIVFLTSICIASFSVLALPNDDSDGRGKGRGEGRTPPQEAIDACNSKAEGEEVTFTTPRGHEVTGVCTTKGDLFVAVPNDRNQNRGRRPDDNQQN